MFLSLPFCFKYGILSLEVRWKMDEGKKNGLTIRNDYTLVPQNLSVIRVARRLGWTPSRAIVRIQEALPAPLEQQIYLAIASGFGILPESMAKLLRLYLGHQELEIEDLRPSSLSGDVGFSRFRTFAEYLRECLNLLRIVKKEYSDFSITIEHAGVIVLHYGTDNPELLIEMVDNNLEEMCKILHISNKRSYSYRMRTCIWLMAKVIIPENRKNGCPDILDISDFLTISSDKRQKLRQMFQQESLDYLSLDRDSMHNGIRNYGSLAVLREEGMI